MEVINEKIEMYKGLENQIGRRYDITLDEILELAKNRRKRVHKRSRLCLCTRL